MKQKNLVSTSQASNNQVDTSKNADSSSNKNNTNAAKSNEESNNIIDVYA